MAKKLSPQLEKAQAKLKLESKVILAQASNEAVNFFKANFKRQGFLDRSLHKWKPRKKVKKKGKFVANDPGRGILIGKGSGKLKRSIARTALSTKRAIIGVRGKTTPKYASVHNFGLRSGRPKGGSFDMPKRQFMGESHDLSKKISRLIEKRVKKIL
jgi:phage gpG-like protein